VCQFPLSSIVGSLLRLQFTEPVSSEKCGISHESELSFRYQFFAADALWI
jgi:hypothetical protein